MTYGSPEVVAQEKLNISPLITPVGVLILRAETKEATSMRRIRLCKIVSFFFIDKKRHSKHSEEM